MFPIPKSSTRAQCLTRQGKKPDHAETHDWTFVQVHQIRGRGVEERSKDVVTETGTPSMQNSRIQHAVIPKTTPRPGPRSGSGDVQTRGVGAGYCRLKSFRRWSVRRQIEDIHQQYVQMPNTIFRPTPIYRLLMFCLTPYGSLYTERIFSPDSALRSPSESNILLLTLGIGVGSCRCSTSILLSLSLLIVASGEPVA